MGYALALGGLPRILLVGQFRAVLDPLVESCQLGGDRNQVKFAEARRDALKAITRSVPHLLDAL